jgi:hypothetical protein
MFEMIEVIVVNTNERPVRTGRKAVGTKEHSTKM